MELGGIAAIRTGHAAPYLPLFFRLATLACRTSLANSWPASRNSKSMGPNSLPRAHPPPARPTGAPPHQSWAAVLSGRLRCVAPAFRRLKGRACAEHSSTPQVKVSCEFPASVQAPGATEISHPSNSPHTQYADRQVETFDNGSVLRYDRLHWCDDFGHLLGLRFSRKPKWTALFPGAEVIAPNRVRAGLAFGSRVAALGAAGCTFGAAEWGIHWLRESQDG